MTSRRERRAAIKAVRRAIVRTLPYHRWLRFRAIDNPHGEGVIVFCPHTIYSGVERLHAWVVVDKKPFPVNGPSKTATPDRPWGREADAELWARTGLVPANHTLAVLSAAGLR